MEYQELMNKAKAVAQNAYAKYSNFQVGACVLTENEKTYVGCNFENASFGLSICAERNAIGTAIADGEKKIKAIAIYSPQTDNCFPCGACRQVLHEFKYDNNIDIILQNNNKLAVYKLTELLPEGFNL